MCHHLWIASPLTLSELRAMLPATFTADTVTGDERRLLLSWAPAARETIRLRIGGCACALYLERDEAAAQSEESALRGRYFRQGVPRDEVIRALDRHRAATRPPVAAREHRAAFAQFVAEHARTGGPLLAVRVFSAEARLPLAEAPQPTPLQAVRTTPCQWLPEDRPVRVEP